MTSIEWLIEYVKNKEVGNNRIILYTKDLEYAYKKANEKHRDEITDAWNEKAYEDVDSFVIDNRSAEEYYKEKFEIYKAAANLANPNTDKTNNFIEGAKWYKEQLKNK
jgi:hypothetical protein